MENGVKNILVIGGSYFLGKCFLEQLLGACAEHIPGEVDEKDTGESNEKLCISVMNRGSVPMDDLLSMGQSLVSDGRLEIRHLIADRQDNQTLRQLASEYFADRTIDAVVDFCGYTEGDIQGIFDSFQSIRQYIFISTVDVYRRGTGQILDENTPYEDRNFGGEAGAYILGKVALEKELRSCCERTGTVWTILRPAVIYGPGNYAPREGMYFHWIREAGQILHPVDATGWFQMVYVEDVAKIILRCVGNEMTYDKAYNVCDSQTLTYETFADILTTATGVQFTKVELPVQEILQREIPLPFPLRAEESERYSGERVKELGVTFTDAVQGMQQSYRLFHIKNR